MPNTLDNLYGISSVTSSALENSHVLITPTTYGVGGPFTLLQLTAINFDTGSGYMILVFDSATLPANGAVAPIFSFFVGVATSTVPSFLTYEFEYPLKATNGIVVAGSTTLTTPLSLAVGTASKLWFQAQVTA